MPQMLGAVHKTAQASFYTAEIQDGREPWFGLELWFLTFFRGEPVWALNREHLIYLIDYLSADLREKPFSIPGKTQADHLPSFMKTAVLSGNWCKFSQNRDLREFLLSTGDCVLVEASPYDNIWGIRLSASSSEAQDPMKWRGQNLLGFALMEVRDELRRVTQNETLCDWNSVWEEEH